MKRQLIIIAALLLSVALYSQPKLYLGARGGIDMLKSHYRLPSVLTVEGTQNANYSLNSPAFHLKGEALVGISRLRLGYRYLNSETKRPSVPSSFPITDAGRYTLYFNGGRNHLFGHYGVVEIAVINTKFFSLAPGIAAGSFTGYRIDKDTRSKVKIADFTDRRFSIGAEINAEIRIGRLSLMFSPHYYLLSQRDRNNVGWHMYSHLIGADLGIRVNMLKP